jgi:hypothetical protein
LLVPNREAAEQMVALCESWALENNVFFSSDPDPKKSKSKVVYMCGQNTGLAKPSPLNLGGRVLPWVPTATHLGHELHESGTMEHDARVKRVMFISKSLEIRETFSFASPVEIMRAVTWQARYIVPGGLLKDLPGQYPEERGATL